MEKTFAKGFKMVKRAKSPDFVIGSISINVENAIQFLQENVRNGYVNLDVLTSKKDGEYNVYLNEYQPNKDDF